MQAQQKQRYETLKGKELAFRNKKRLEGPAPLFNLNDTLDRAPRTSMVDWQWYRDLIAYLNWWKENPTAPAGSAAKTPSFITPPGGPSTTIPMTATTETSWRNTELPKEIDYMLFYLKPVLEKLEEDPQRQENLQKLKEYLLLEISSPTLNQIKQDRKKWLPILEEKQQQMQKMLETNNELRSYVDLLAPLYRRALESPDVIISRPLYAALEILTRPQATGKDTKSAITVQSKDELMRERLKNVLDKLEKDPNRVQNLMAIKKYRELVTETNTLIANGKDWHSRAKDSQKMRDANKALDEYVTLLSSIYSQSAFESEEARNQFISRLYDTFIALTAPMVATEPVVIVPVVAADISLLEQIKAENDPAVRAAILQFLELEYEAARTGSLAKTRDAAKFVRDNPTIKTYAASYENQLADKPSKELTEILKGIIDQLKTTQSASSGPEVDQKHLDIFKSGMKNASAEAVRVVKLVLDILLSAQGQGGQWAARLDARKETYAEFSNYFGLIPYQDDPYVPEHHKLLQAMLDSLPK